jgi:hypothetical protein
MSSLSIRVIPGVLALAVAVPFAPAAAAAGTPTPMALATGATSTVTLVTGDTVTVTTDAGRTDLSVDQHGTGGYQGYRDATGDEHLVPAIAQPYLGRLLDPALFDVSAMIRDGLTGAARIPVTLTYAAGNTPTAPAGVTLTSTAGTTATGYLTPTSALAFAAALRHGIGADVTAGRHPGSTAPLAGLAGIRLAEATTRVMTPQYALYPLHITETDDAGAPADGTYVTIVNTDSVTRQQSQVPIAGGVGQVEVPAGHYSAVADFTDFDAAGEPTALRQVTVPDFTVTAGATPTALSIAESSATAPVTVTTPETTTPGRLAVYEARGDTSGGSTSNFLATEGLPVYVAPAAAPQVGTSHFVVSYSATASATDSQYDVAFADDHGIPASESYQVRRSELATVRQRLSTDPASTGKSIVFTAPVDPALQVIAVSIANWATPGVLTHYFGTDDGGTWLQAVTQPNFSEWTDQAMTFAAGRNYPQDWGHGPLAIDFGSHYTGQQVCHACVGNGYLMVQPNWGGDSTLGHSGSEGDLLIDNTSIGVYQNGTPLPTNPEDAFFGVAGVPQAPTTYRMVFDHTAAAGPGFSQSLSEHTDLTVHYAPTTDPSQELPGQDLCASAGDSVTAGPACQILPFLSVDYQLASDLTNTSTSPMQRLGLTIGHISYDGRGSHSPITSASLAVSFDNGTTWQPVPLIGALGDYVATWPNPHVTAATPGPELKVTAADADGNTITQTVSAAYTIGSAK